MTDEAFSVELNWRQLSAQDREREYSPSSCVDYKIEPYLHEYAEQSATSFAWCEDAGYTVQTLRYGSRPTQTIDVVSPGTELAPMVVFIHGGYWQALSKRESFGPAAEFVARGVAFAAVDYTLAPGATLDQIVQECRTALAFLHAQAAQLHVDPDRIVVAGSSAGAHLTAMVALDSSRAWQPAGVILLSGIFEIEPLIGTTVNEALRLDVVAAHRNSPSRLPIARPAPALVAWGDNETQQFKRQSQLFASALSAAGAPVTRVEAGGRNHFDIVGDLAATTTDLGLAAAALIDSTRKNDA